MKIAYSHYQLSSEREGVLLKVNFEDGKTGYADCHPWVEFGDLPISMQLDRLKSFELTLLTKRSLYFAKIDAEARSKKKNLFEGLEIPKSHYLYNGNAIPEEFEVVKIKLRDDFSILSKIPPHQKIRIDFNGKLNYQTFLIFLEKYKKYHPRIEFIEDPFPYDKKLWDQFKIIASDHEGEPNHYQYKILKPAKEDEKIWKIFPNIVVTTYLDHPLGQLCAAYIATKIPQVKTCGLLSHLVYPPNSFSEQLSIKNTRLVPPNGYGFGFDQLLTNQKWIALND